MGNTGHDPKIRCIAATMKQNRKKAQTHPPEETSRQDGMFIVSSSHLAVPGAEDLSEFEFALTVANHAFQRWMTCGMQAVGARDLSPLDVLVLHCINHRNRPKSISDILFMLNISERHYLNYSMKKLEKMELISKSKAGKEVFLQATPKCSEACQDYARVRQACLLDLIPKDRGVAQSRIDEVARALRVLTGFYEQASRAATSL